MMKAAIVVLLFVGVVSAGSKNKQKRELRISRQRGCDVDEFQCNNGICIPEEWTCDSDNDCWDDSDENIAGCTKECTGEHKVQCKNGDCVPMEFRCDGDDDCNDGTDEAGCKEFTCTGHEVHCSNGRCIEQRDLCDGFNDCGDNWDENPANCPSPQPAV